MRVLVAPQEFKGSLSARQVAEAIASGFHRAVPQAAIDLAPMADGGPGTVEAVVTAKGGEFVSTMVSDPLGRPVSAVWGVIDGGRTAVIEAAAACGLVLLREHERDPRVASTYGVGQLIAAAIARGCQRVIIGVGGSATNDGGAGMAQALGVRILAEDGQELPPGGAPLSHATRIDTSRLIPGVKDYEFLVASDVANPLLGPHGATATYGPQKGAAPQMVEELEAALSRYAQVLKQDLGIDVADLPGAGAAGGLPASLIAFLGARLLPGAELVAEAINLKERLAAADLVITGEGRLDSQTGFGKGPLVVAHLAKEQGTPVVVLAGGVADDAYALHAEGIDAIFSIASRPLSLEDAMAGSYQLTARAAEEIARLLLLGRRFRRDGR